MTKGVTTSIRLAPALRDRLEHVADVMHRGKNWIINQALIAYLNQLNAEVLKKEARRQSLLANKADKEEELWENNNDTTGWI